MQSTPKRLSFWRRHIDLPRALFLAYVLLMSTMLGIWFACASSQIGVDGALPWEPDRGFVEQRCGPLTWRPERLPIPVYLDVADGARVPDVLDAMNFWNALMHRAPMEWAGPYIPIFEPPRPAIVVSVDSFMEDRALAQLFWDSSCHLILVQIRLPARVPRASSRRMAVHEFGHALGLAHDESSLSVMYPTIPRFMPDEFIVTAADITRLWAVYDQLTPDVPAD